MAVLTIAAVQATYALMDRDATIDRVEVLTAGAAEQGAQLVVFPEENGPWIEPGNTVSVGPDGALLDGPLREAEGTLIADLDLTEVAASRRFMDPTGHCNRPDSLPPLGGHQPPGGDHRRQRGPLLTPSRTGCGGPVPVEPVTACGRVPPGEDHGTGLR